MFRGGLPGRGARRRGEGEPVVCIHGAFVADTFRPLLAERELTNHYRLVTYRRRGYVGSTKTAGPVSSRAGAWILATARHSAKWNLKS